MMNSALRKLVLHLIRHLSKPFIIIITLCNDVGSKKQQLTNIIRTFKINKNDTDYDKIAVQVHRKTFNFE